MNRGRDFTEVWKEFIDFVGMLLPSLFPPSSPSFSKYRLSTSPTYVIMMGDKEVYKWSHKLHGTPKDDEIDAMEWIRLKPLLGERKEGEGEKEGEGKEEEGRQALNLGGLDSGQLYEKVGMRKEEVCPGLSGHDALFDACSMALFCTKF